MEQKNLSTVNFCSEENGVKIHSFSSQNLNCPATNILLSDQKKIWLSENGVPQHLILDFSNAKNKPQFYRCFGLECWHDYNTNPSLIELLVSKNDKDFVSWKVILPKLKAGSQFFSIDPLDNSYNFLKIIIKETFGDAKTYLNRIYLLEQNPLDSLADESQDNMEESNLYLSKKDDDDILAKYLPNPAPKSEKNNSFVLNSQTNSAKKTYPASSKTTGIRFFSNNEHSGLTPVDRPHTETNLKAKNLLKYYDKFLNYKSESTKNEPNEPQEEITEKQIKINGGTQVSSTEIQTIKEEIAKFEKKFEKMQENMDFLIGKQTEIHKSLQIMKEDKLSQRNSKEDRNTVEIQENQDENVVSGKIYSKMEEFLSRLNEENDKIIEENNNLKGILEMKVNSIEERIQRISEKSNQEQMFEKKIEEMIERNIENLSRTINENLEKQSENIEKKMLLSLKKSNSPNYTSFINENETVTLPQTREKPPVSSDWFKKKKSAQTKKNQLQDFFQKLDIRLSQREKEIEALDNEILNSKSKMSKNQLLSNKSERKQKLDFYREYD